jgi:hypothetical protein
MLDGAANLGAFLVREQALNEDLKLVARKCSEARQAGVQVLQLCFAHPVQVDAMSAFVSARPLQPARENFGGTWIGEGALSEPTLDLGIGRRSAVTAAYTVSPSEWRCEGAPRPRLLYATPPVASPASSTRPARGRNLARAGIWRTLSRC